MTQGGGMVLHKVLDQYVQSYQRWIKSVVRLGQNEVLKTLTKTLTFVDADANAAANAAAEGSTIALRERCSGELKMNERICSPVRLERSLFRSSKTTWPLLYHHENTSI